METINVPVRFVADDKPLAMSVGGVVFPNPRAVRDDPAGGVLHCAELVTAVTGDRHADGGDSQPNND